MRASCSTFDRVTEVGPDRGGGGGSNTLTKDELEETVKNMLGMVSGV